jgi:acyl-coenzyme A thioesterase PaaI-like protein
MIGPGTREELRRPDPFLDFSGTRVVEADAEHAIAEQGPAAELDNHAGVRHAGALFAVGYAASRALVAAALETVAVPAAAGMVGSDVDYERVVAAELVTATAEPSGDDWSSLLGRVADGESVQLPTTVTLRNEGGKTVSSMSFSWQVASAPGDETR